MIQSSNIGKISDATLCPTPPMHLHSYGILVAISSPILTPTPIPILQLRTQVSLLPMVSLSKEDKQCALSLSLSSSYLFNCFGRCNHCHRNWSIDAAVHHHYSYPNFSRVHEHTCFLRVCVYEHTSFFRVSVYERSSRLFFFRVPG